MIKKIIKWWKNSFIRKVLSYTGVRALLFAIFFPYLIFYALDLLRKPLGFSWEFSSIIAFAPGICMVYLLMKAGVIHSSYIVMLYQVLFNAFFYFMLYLVIHYIKLKWKRK